MSYYGYVERKPEDMQVNWGEISQGILKSVQEWEQGREDLREKLDKETRETQKAIAETPEVRDESTSSFVLKASNEAATKLSKLNKMLKSNKITPREYTLKRANINSDMTEFYTFIKGFDQAYRSKTDKLNSGEMSVVEEKETQKVLDMLKGGLGDLSPEFDETGTLLFSTSKGTRSMRDVFKMGTFSYKKKDLITDFQKIGSQIAAVEKNYNSSGRLNEEGIDLIDTKITAALSNKFDVADLLNDAGHTDLFEIEDGQEVTIKEGGMERAAETLRNAALSAMGERGLSEPKAKEAEKPTEAQREARHFGKSLRNLNDLGNQVYVANAIGAKSMSYDGSKLTIVNKDGAIQTVPLAPNQVADWIIKRSGLDQDWAQRGLGGNVDVGAMNYSGAVKPVAKAKRLDMYDATDDNGKNIGNKKLPDIELSNLVGKLQELNPDYSEKFKYKNDAPGPRILFMLKNDENEDEWKYAQTINQFNDAVEKFNIQYAK